MKSSSLGPLIALSALAVAPSVAFAQEPSTTPPAASVATTPEPAPSLTSPPTGVTEVAPPSTPDTAGSTTPQAMDPVIDESTKKDEDSGPDDESSAKSKDERRQERREARESQAERDPAPTNQATDTTLIDPSTLTVTAVPNFFIEDFDIPPFLLPIYQAAGSEYGIRWEVLAAINRIETNYGRNLNVSSAGALGWMQFMPATWESYGVDANDDGKKDPFNPADAIFAAARYLKAADGDKDLRKAVFAYNHADWYVDDVLEGARNVAAIPDSLVSSLTALTQGIFPVDAPDAKIDYPGKTEADGKGEKVKAGSNAADPVKGSDERNSIEITADAGTRVVAIQDGVVEKVGTTKRLGKFVRIRDSYGNRYTYGNLGELQEQVPVPKPAKSKEGLKEDEAHSESDKDVKPTAAATEGAQTDIPAPTSPASDAGAPSSPDAPSVPTTKDEPAATTDTPVTTTVDPAVNTTPTATEEQAAKAKPAKRERLTAQVSEEKTEKSKANEPRRIRFRARDASGAVNTAPEPIDGEATRLYAHPALPDAFAAGGEEQLNPEESDDTTVAPGPVGELGDYFSIDYGLKADDVNLKKLKAGQAVIAGTVLGKTKLALDGQGTSKVTFEIRPAGKKAPRIDPQPILDGWRQSDKTDFLAAQAKKSVAAGESTDDATVGQILLMSKAELTERVLADERISIYEGGRNDIKGGVIDRRILALLEVLATKGVEPVVTSLRSGHGTMTSSGNVSQHTTGTAVDIASAYGTVITPATQGPGTVTDRAVREILELQGNMKPDQIITLMTYEGEDNTLSMADHDDHIHVGYRPTTGVNGKQLEQLLKPGQWDALVNQLSTIEVPNVSAKPSDYSVSVDKSKKTK